MGSDNNLRLGVAECGRIRLFNPGFDGALFLLNGGMRYMGQVLHGSATTTEAIRRAIQYCHFLLSPRSTDQVP